MVAVSRRSRKKDPDGELRTAADLRMSSSSPRTSPLFFGPPEGRLFGCYDPPRGRPNREAAVVLCYPAGHEYVASHRAMRQLAARLCSKGFGVLRFDYYGTGDSAGESEDYTIARARRDVELAIDEARALSRCSEVDLVGLRIGGTIAALVGAGRRGLSRLVLWDPVVDGRRHLEELAALEGKRAGMTPEPARGDALEVMGFSLSGALRGEIGKIDLTSAKLPDVERVLVLGTRPGPEAETLAQAYRSGSSSVRFERLEAPELLLENVDRVAVPARVINGIVSWISDDRP